MARVEHQAVVQAGQDCGQCGRQQHLSGLLRWREPVQASRFRQRAAHAANDRVLLVDKGRIALDLPVRLLQPNTSKG